MVKVNKHFRLFNVDNKIGLKEAFISESKNDFIN